MTYPRSLVALLALCSAVGFTGYASPFEGVGQVRQVPAVNGGATVEGSLHMMGTGSVNLNGGATITGDLLVSGTPTVRINGSPAYGGTLEGDGAATPTNYTITLNSGASLRHVIRRTAPLTLPTVANPPSPTGSRSVNVNTAGQAIGDWVTLRNLTLNSNVGAVAVPAGTYGDFTANSGSSFTLGVAGATEPAVYNFQRLTFNGQSRLDVVGPVVLNLKNGLNANGVLGAADHPEWLSLNIAAGGLTLNSGSALHGYLVAPSTSGSVIINGNASLVGGLICHSLTLNSGGLLRLRQGGGGEPVNTAPVAQDQNLTTAEDTAFTFTLSATDAEGDALTYTVITPPAHGTLGGTAPALIYTPAANFHGADSLTFRATDSAGATSELATVSIAVTPVNDAPEATPQALVLDEDTTLAITLAGNDVDGDVLTYAITAGPTHGTLSGTAPDLVYTPFADYHGSDSFQFTVSDGELTSAPATISLAVRPVNDAPIAAGQNLTVAEGETLSIALTASDADGDALTYSILTTPAAGELTLADGSPLPPPGTSLPPGVSGLRYTPPANQTGGTSFTFRANDGAADSAPAAITISFTNRNDVPVAHPGTVELDEDTSAAIPLAATDPDGDLLTYAIATQPAHGVVTLAGNLATYTPTANHHGADSFTFVATDNGSPALTSAPATVSLIVRPVNDAPTVVLQQPADGEVFDFGTVVMLLAQPSDPDGEPDLARVEFFVDDSLAGAATASPWHFTWDAAVTGLHTLRAEAVDQAGARGVSATVQVRVRAPLPGIVSFAAALPAAPAASIGASPASGTAPLAATLTWTSTDSPQVEVSGPGLSSTEAAGSVAVTLAEAGDFVFSITAAPQRSALLTWSAVNAASLALRAPGGGLVDVTAHTSWSVGEEGTWTLLARNSDGLEVASGEVVVAWPPAATASTTIQVEAPVLAPLAVDLGEDRLISLPTTVTPSPAITRDGAPVTDGLIYSWQATPVTGGGTATITPPGAALPVVSFSAPGRYSIRLTVTTADGSASGADELFVDVQPAPVTPEVAVGSSEGHDFWVTFLRAGPRNELVVTSATQASGLITEYVPVLGLQGTPNGVRTVSTYFTVSPGQPYRFLPAAYNGGDDTATAFLYATGETRKAAVRIRADAPVSVHGLSASDATTDGFAVLPAGLLGRGHFLASHNGILGGFLGNILFPATFAVVGTQDGTACLITPSVPLSGAGGVVRAEPFTVYLNRGEVARFDCADTEDITGTAVDADKPVAVFSGVVCARVPVGTPACDIIVEQMLADEYWGKNYAVSPMIESYVPMHGLKVEDPVTGESVVVEDYPATFNGDQVRVIARESGTRVSLNGVPVATLGAGEFAEFAVKTPSLVVGDKPVAVAQYMRGQNGRWAVGDNFQAVQGDPLMLMVPAIEQFGRRLQFYAFDRDYPVGQPGPFAHYAGVIVDSAGLAGLRLNGGPVDAALFTPIPDTTLVAANIPAPAGFNTLEADSPFFGIGWGIFSYESYGFTGAISVGRSPQGSALELAPLPPAALTGAELRLAARVITAAGEPVGGIRVAFEVAGVHAGAFTALTDAQGWAMVSYTGVAPGADSLTVSAGELTRTAAVSWRAPSAGANQPPSVEVGPDREVYAGDAFSITATITDDGLGGVAPPAIAWQVLGGFAGVEIVSPAAPTTAIVFPLPGRYLVRATVHDGELMASGEAWVTVRGGSSIRLLSPRPGAVVPPGDYYNPQGGMLIEAAASSDTGIAQVEFFVGADRVGEPLRAAPFTYRHYFNYTFGTHQVSARLTTVTGEVYVSETVTVTVPDTVRITQVAPTWDTPPLIGDAPLPFAVTLEGGVAPYYVQFIQGDVTGPVLAEFFEGPYAFLWDAAHTVPYFDRNITVRVIDAAGRSSVETFWLGYFLQPDLTAAFAEPAPGEPGRYRLGDPVRVVVRVAGVDGMGNYVLLRRDGGYLDEIWFSRKVADNVYDYEALLENLPAGSFQLSATVYPEWGGVASDVPPVEVRVIDTATHPAPVVSLGPDLAVEAGAPFSLPHIVLNPPDPGQSEAYVLSATPEAGLLFAWTQVSGPELVFGDARSLATPVGFSGPGVYTLRLSVDDGVLYDSDELVVTVSAPASNQPPGVAASFPPATLQADYTGRASSSVEVTASDPDGDPVTVEFYRRDLAEAGSPAVKRHTVALQPGIPAVWNFSDLAPGAYEFHVTARDNRGGQISTAPAAVTVLPPAPDDDLAARLAITTPGADATVIAPVGVRGHARLGGMSGYRLEVRPSPVPGQPAVAWSTFATGASPVGSDNADGLLGSFDPSLLRNGPHEIRVTADFTSGAASRSSETVSVLVDGKRKVGQFSVAFRDLALPLAGVPIEIVRAYDSRDRLRAGDFGHGWSLAVNAVSLRLNRALGTDWKQEVESISVMGSPILRYTVSPDSAPGGSTPVRHLVTLHFPDDTLATFEAELFVQGGGLGFLGIPVAPWQRLVSPIAQVSVGFRPANVRTKGRLEIDGSSVAYLPDIQTYGPGPMPLRTEPDPFAPVFNPTRFRYTSEDGTVYRLDSALGLLSVADPQGNTLELERDPATGRLAQISHSSGQAVLIHRAAAGFVESIEDPYGQRIDYVYDAHGDLAGVTDRAGNSTAYGYYTGSPLPAEAHLAHYLREIIDPKGTQVLRNEYDDEGRLVRQFDADGNPVEFIRDEANVEKIRDRLGYITRYRYDDEGNILSRHDRTGGGASYEYADPANPNAATTEAVAGSSPVWRTYDAAGRQLSTRQHGQTVDGGREVITRTTYDERGNPLVVTAPNGAATTTAYNAQGLPVSMTDALGRVTRFERYDSRGNLERLVDAAGGVTESTYDAFDRLLTQTDPAGNTTAYTYDAAGHLATETRTVTTAAGTPRALVTEYEYDGEGRVTSTRHPDGTVTATEYDANGRPERLTDALGRVTVNRYDAQGRLERVELPPVSVPAPGGGVVLAHYTEEFIHDAEGRRTHAKDRADRWTRSYYDPEGRALAAYRLPASVVSRADALASPVGAGTRLSTSVCDAYGRMIDAYDARGNWTRYEYDNQGRRRKAYAPGAAAATIRLNARGDGLAMAWWEGGSYDSSRVTEYGYDILGNLATVTDPLRGVTRHGYDTLGRRTSTQLPDGTWTGQAYDELGRVAEETDAEGKITRRRHDALGRLAEVRQYLDTATAASDAGFSLPASAANVVSTTYAYDELGRQTAQTDALGRVTRYEYDEMGRRTARILPDGARETFAYDAAGNLESRTDFNGETTTCVYDEHDRLIERTPSMAARLRGATRAEFSYTATGRRETQRLYDAANQSVWWENYVYDEADRLAWKQTPLGTLTYLHDAQGNLEALASGNGSELHYAYDSDNRLTEVEDRRGVTTGADGRITDYGYTRTGALDFVVLPNEVAVRHTYTAAHRLVDIHVSHAGLSIVGFSYELRPGGRRQALEERIGGAQTIGSPRRTAWTYDGLHRLTSESVTAGSGDAPATLGTIGYTYDKVGNRLTRASGNPVVASRTSTYNARDWLNTDTYDANGNTKQAQVTGHTSHVTDSYDDQNRLVSRTEAGAGGRTIRILYDADGNRVKKSVTTPGEGTVTTYYLVDTLNPTGYAQVLEEFTQVGSGPITLTKSYAYGLDLISEARHTSQGTRHSYYGYDGLGSVRYLTSETGAITDRYYYDAYGTLLHHIGTSDNAYLYAGEQWDSDLGLYYNRARYLNPDSGRFWSADEFEGVNAQPQSLHRYLYAHADPVNGIDPSGHYTLSQVMTSLGVVGKLYSLAVMSITVAQVAVDAIVLRNIYQPLMNALRLGVEDPLNILSPLERLLFEKHLIKVEEKALIFGMKTILKSAVVIKPIVAAAVVGITTLAVDGFQWQHVIPGLGTYLQIRDFVSYAHVLRQDLNLLGVSVGAPPSSGPVALVSYAVGTSRIITHTYEELARARGGRSS